MYANGARYVVMPRDVDEVTRAGKRRPGVVAGALLQRLVVGALHDHHVEADAADLDAPDGVAGVQPATVRRGLSANRALERGEVAPARGRVVRGEALVVRTRELRLLEVRVERCERVLPAPDDDDPEQGERARCDEQRAEDAREAWH